MTFVALAERALARDERLAFVTGCGDPSGAPLRPCTVAMLLGRPAIEVPTLFRAGLPLAPDGTLAFGRETDLALRLLDAGFAGAVLDVPLRGSSGDPGPLLRKHAAIVERQAEEILIVKESWLRALAACSRARHEGELRLRRELASLEDEAALLERCLR